MRYRLLVLKHENAADYSRGKNLRFTVVDLDRAKDDPANFVCLLPTRLSSNGIKSNRFEGIFGNRSFEVAKKMLTEALESESDNNVRNEIERRLKLLDPESSREKTCVSCGKAFQTDPKKRLKQSFC